MKAPTGSRNHPEGATRAPRATTRGLSEQAPGYAGPQRVPPPSAAAVDPAAYRPDARARALLHGIRLVEADLTSSGGAYTLAEVRDLLRGVSRRTIGNRVREGRLLAVPGPGNRALYPVAQFLEDGRPVPGLGDVLAALPTNNAWMVLNFLVNAEPGLDGRKPIDLLKAGDLAAVLAVARGVGRQGA